MQTTVFRCVITKETISPLQRDRTTNYRATRASNCHLKQPYTITQCHIPGVVCTSMAKRGEKKGPDQSNSELRLFTTGLRGKAKRGEGLVKMPQRLELDGYNTPKLKAYIQTNVLIRQTKRSQSVATYVCNSAHVPPSLSKGARIPGKT